MKFRSASAVSAVLLGLLSFTSQAVGQVRILSAAPVTVQPGNTFVMTGTGFPAGVSGANVTVQFAPVTGGVGPTVTAALAGLATAAGTTMRATITIPASLLVNAPTPYQATLSATVAPAFTTATPGKVTVDPPPSLLSVNPLSGHPGQAINALVTGSFTNFFPGTSKANFGPGTTVNTVSVANPTSLTANVTIAPGATLGANNVIITTGSELDTLTNGFAILPVPAITDFNPKSAPAGTLVTVTGTNLQPLAGTAAQFTLAKQGGGTISGFASSATTTSLTFIIPAGAATGIPSVTVNAQIANAAATLAINAPSTFSLNAAPGAASVIQGQSVGVAVSLTSTSGFTGLAALSVAGVPTGVTAAFHPQSISAGQNSILTLTAPASQPIATSALTISASAAVSGIPLTQTSNVSLSVAAPTTSFLGRAVVSDSLETALAGVTVAMMGKDGNGNTTGCSGSTVSDVAGNFALVNLSAACVGPQLIGFNGTTVTSPTGTYAGVNLTFTFVAGQVTPSPILVHLPRIDNAETFYVQQNYSTDQSYSYQTIPGLSVTAYAHTTFTMPDGTTPNPFPLAAVNVPVDRLPALKPQVPTMLAVFIVAFQPANASTSQPVAVYYPNTTNTPPGTDTTLMTLDPTHGVMVPYGTASVSSDGTQFVPDMDPAHPGHRYGLQHFDWHMVGTPPGNQANPCGGITPCPCCGDPVDLSSGLAVIHETDISYGGARGTISITRTYRSGANQPLATEYGPFGYGTNHNWGYQLDTAFPSTANVISLIMPDGNRFAFSKQGDGTFANSGIPAMGGGVMTVNGGNTSLRWKDGTTFGFIAIISSGFSLSFLDSVTDANGNRFQIIHNGAQIEKIVDPTGRGLSFNYNTGGHITQITAPDGSNVSYDYRGDQGGVLRQVRRPDGGIVQYSYDTLTGDLTSVTDNVGALFASNTYDSNRRVIQQRVGDGGVWNFSYTLQNPLAGLLSPVLATSVTDPLGKQTVYRFSPNGAMIGVTDALGQMRTIDRDGGNYLVGLRGSGVCAVCGDTTAGDQTFSYDDSTGNLLSHTDGLGNTTTFTYEPMFNKVSSATDPLGGTTLFTYDSRGNLLTQTDPNGNVTSFQYDQFGELIQTTDPTNQTTAFSYDSNGNLVTITDPIGDVTSLRYDINGRLIQTVDALGRSTAFGYDKSNRILSEANASAGITQFAYDTRGNLLSVADARGNKTSFTYDLLDRLLTRQDGIGRTDGRIYDLDGKLTTFLDRRGQTSTFTYDAINRLSGESYQDGSTVARSYDASSRLANVNDSAGGVFTFTYDLAGRTIGSTTPFGAINYTRDNLGRATNRQVVGQPAVSYSYDSAGNLLSASTTAASISRTYDPRNLLSTASRMNGVTSQYTYDQLGRLASLTHAGPAGPLNIQTYAYDAVGNRTSATNSVAQSLATPAVTPTLYDKDNEQVQFGSTSNAFDAGGDLVSSTASGGATTYNWDSRGRLISVSGPGGQTTSFTYDFSGNLIQQKDAGPTTNLTQTFLLDSLTNVAYVNRSDGDAYSVLAGRSLDDHMAVVHSNGQIEYGLTDGLNSTIATADQTGAIRGRFTYEPFGQTTATNSSYPFQYTGRVPVSTSLYYNRARFYSPTTGRFISEDPLGLIAGPNFYAYTRGNPIGFTDPFGLDLKTTYKLFKSLYEFSVTVSTVAQNIGAAGAYSGTGDLGQNQSINSGPLLNLDSDDPNAAYNFQKYQSQFYGGASLSANQIATGVNGPPGQDVWQYLKAAAKFGKACMELLP